MTLVVPLDHPTFTLKDTVVNICSSFLNQHGFSYFQYCRLFNDGSISVLLNYTDMFEHFQKMKFPPFSSFKEEHKMQFNYYFLWDEELPWLPVQIARTEHNIHHGLTLLRRHYNYYDMIAFAMPEERSNAASYYLSKQKAIEEFINYFDLKYNSSNNSMLYTTLNSPISLPEWQRDSNYNKICLNNANDYFSVMGIDGKTHITLREFESIKLLTQGYSYKEIAKQLNLSPRTIETYINRVKVRTGFTSRLDLAKLIISK